MRANRRQFPHLSTPARWLGSALLLAWLVSGSAMAETAPDGTDPTMAMAQTCAAACEASDPDAPDVLADQDLPAPLPPADEGEELGAGDVPAQPTQAVHLPRSGKRVHGPARSVARRAIIAAYHGQAPPRA